MACIIMISILIDIEGWIIMVTEYKEYANLFKAMSDPTRLKILDMVSCSPMCACDILERVEIGQSTLSYHMKILIDNKLVTSTPKGSWMWYSVSIERIEEIRVFLKTISSDKEFCICKNEKSHSENKNCQCGKERRV